MVFDGDLDGRNVNKERRKRKSEIRVCGDVCFC